VRLFFIGGGGIFRVIADVLNKAAACELAEQEQTKEPGQNRGTAFFRVLP
jgi:hypothetical protein